MLLALNKISNSRANPTELTGKTCNHLLDYLATHSNAVICYHASSGIVLCLVSDAAYLVLPNACSRCICIICCCLIAVISLQFQNYV